MSLPVQAPIPVQAPTAPLDRLGWIPSAALPRRADALLAAGLAAAAVAATLLVPAESAHRPPGVLGVVLVLSSALALAWRQSATALVTVGCSVLLVVNSAAGFSVGVIQWPPWLALFTCFAHGGLRTRLIGFASCVGAVSGYFAFDRGTPTAATLVGIVACALIATVGGEAARGRHAVAEAEQSRRMSEARERTLAIQRVQLEERGRLAGELHDALGHTVNVMVLQAGVARRVFDGKPDFARQALANIETIGREALGELDRVLRALEPRPTDDPPAVGRERASPASLGDLAERIRATGREVDLDLDLDPGVLAPGASRALYRIVQESLTNAVRHTSSGRIRVTVARAGDRVRVEVVNAGAGFGPPVPGRGLVGMRERARLEHGTFDAGPIDGGFRVLATLPLAREGAA